MNGPGINLPPKYMLVPALQMQPRGGVVTARPCIRHAAYTGSF